MSVQVAYKNRKFKVPCTPQTPLFKIRDTVCTGDLNLPSNEYGFEKNGKFLDLTLPLRLANLVNNATLNLSKKTLKQEVKVKIKIPNSSDFIRSFSGSTTVGEVQQIAKLDNSLAIQTTIIEPGTTLDSFGLDSIQFSVSGAKASTNALSSGNQALSSTNTDSTRFEDSNVEPEMNKSQFMAYRKHLKAVAEPPLISEHTKNQMKQAKNEAIQSTVLRIRFPENRSLENEFPKGSKGEDVYIYVRTQLTEKAQFELITPGQGKLGLEDNLINDCNFGSRAVLQFKSSTPVTLKGEAQKPKPATQPAHHSSQSVQKPGSSQPEAKNETQTPPPKEKKFKLPKWFKLHK